MKSLITIKIEHGEKTCDGCRWKRNSIYVPWCELLDKRLSTDGEDRPRHPDCLANAQPVPETGGDE